VGISGRACCANTAPILSAQADRTIAELTQLIVTNTATDTSTAASNLTYSLVGPPAGAAIDGNGIISWTPTRSQGPAAYDFTTIVTDGGSPPLSATNHFTVTVTEVNSAPSLPAQTNRTIPELSQLTVTNTATDSDIPANVPTYTLIDPPAGATIDTNGIISWTPSEAQGPSTNVITTVVSDNGVPPLSATNSFTVAVLEVNSAPVLAEQSNRTIVGMHSLSVTNAAVDSDIPANILTYNLIAAPTNAAVDAQGIISWIPSLSQVPSTNIFRTMVTDDGVPPLSATNEFVVVVQEIHNGPSLPALADLTADPEAAIVVTNTAADTDVPVWPLHYELLNAPAGASIDQSGIIRWTPSDSQAPSTNIMQTVVSDAPASGKGAPISSSNQFTIIIDRLPAQPPRIESITITNQLAVVSWTTVPGYMYRLQYCNDLSATNSSGNTNATWIDSGFEGTASGISLTGSNSVADIPQRFYRVLLVK
jgi:hypothetical protein